MKLVKHKYKKNYIINNITTNYCYYVYDIDESYVELKFVCQVYLLIQDNKRYNYHYDFNFEEVKI